MSLLIFLLILVGLVLIHEWGHFFTAKIFGIRVDEFGVGFPPRLFGIRRGETVYTLNALPFGGFVKIFGEDSGSDDNPRRFTNKPRVIQMAVIVAGIVCNLLFAWLLLSVGYMVGLPSSTHQSVFGDTKDVHTIIVGVVPNSPADKAGVVAGDKILGAQTATATLVPKADAAMLQQFITDHPNDSVILTIERGSKELTLLAKPVDGLVQGHKAIGVQLDDAGILQLPLHLAVLQGALLFWQMTQSTAIGLVTFFGTLIRGSANFSQVAGPIGIAGIGASVVTLGFAPTILLTALISINLALINILPVPGLDGGRLAIIALEGIRGRSLSEKTMTRVTLAGFALLILLIIVISYHDLARLFHR